MSSLGRDRPASDPPAQVCTRCSKPITPGTASQVAGRPVHMRCVAWVTRLAAMEQRDRAGLERLHARAASVRTEELMDFIRGSQTRCPACEERLRTSRGVLFQGYRLVHAACWRDDPKPFDASPPTQ